MNKNCLSLFSLFLSWIRITLLQFPDRIDKYASHYTHTLSQVSTRTWRNYLIRITKKVTVSGITKLDTILILEFARYEAITREVLPAKNTNFSSHHTSLKWGQTCKCNNIVLFIHNPHLRIFTVSKIIVIGALSRQWHLKEMKLHSTLEVILRLPHQCANRI